MSLQSEEGGALASGQGSQFLRSEPPAPTAVLIPTHTHTHAHTHTHTHTHTQSGCQPRGYVGTTLCVLMALSELRHGLNTDHFSCRKHMFYKQEICQECNQCCTNMQKMQAKVVKPVEQVPPGSLTGHILRPLSPHQQCRCEGVMV